VKSIRRSLEHPPAGWGDEHHQDSPAPRRGRDAQGGAEGQQALQRPGDPPAGSDS